MSRCVVNVATGPYVPLQSRLVASVRSSGWTGGLLLWSDAWPPGSPSHEEVPYGFKIHAIREAERRGFESVLWLDSPCLAQAPLAPLFERIEAVGHLFVTSHEKLGNWIGDAALAAYELSRDEAMALPLLHGSCFGLRLADLKASAWLASLEQAASLGHLNGPYFTDHAPADVRRRKPRASVGPASTDPRCWGHRHDEAIGSLLAPRFGLTVASAPDLFGPQGAVRLA